MHKKAIKILCTYGYFIFSKKEIKIHLSVLLQDQQLVPANFRYAENLVSVLNNLPWLNDQCIIDDRTNLSPV